MLTREPSSGRHALVVLAAVAAAAVAPHTAAARRRRSERAGVRPALELTAGLSTGYMHDQSIRTEDAALGIAELDAVPSLGLGDFELRAPVDLRHRQTVLASLPELRAAGGLEARYRPSPRLRIEVEGGLLAVWRPGWPDLYQPIPDDGFEDTHRYSYWERRVGGGLTVIPIRHHHARLSYRYSLADYAEDPHFDPVDEPTHLVPSDHEQHEAELGWRFLGDRFALGGGIEVWWRRYFFVFSRDAGTGLTHAPAGGAPPNPLQTWWSLEPELSGEIELVEERLELELTYGHEILIDEHAGYFSYQGPHPQIDLTWTPAAHVKVELDLELVWRTYGSGSYAAGANHPPLEDGDRRYDHRFHVELGAAFPLASHLSLVGGIDLLLRDSNFPDYEPGVFPASRQYDIDWDYVNLEVLVGLEYSIELGDG